MMPGFPPDEGRLTSSWFLSYHFRPVFQESGQNSTGSSGGRVSSKARSRASACPI